MKKILSITLIIIIILSFISISSVYAIEYSDVSSNHWAYEAIKNMSDRGVINGYSDGSFKPDALVTRGEFCKMLALASGIVSDPKKLENSMHWAYPYMDEIGKKTWNYKTWYLSEFTPDTVINRSEAAAGLCDVYLTYPISLIGKMAEVKATLETAYKDTENIGRFSEVVYVMTINNLMNGYEDGCFHPEWQLTRAEICTILYRAFSTASYYKKKAAYEAEYGNAEIEYYFDTIVPSYTSVTGIEPKYVKYNEENETMFYLYDNSGDEKDSVKYVNTLIDMGWYSDEANDVANNEEFSMFFEKGDTVIVFTYYFKTNEISVFIS